MNTTFQNQLLQQLDDLFPGQIDIHQKIPKTYWNKAKDPKKVKAVYLGCDPTNKVKNIQFDYAFAHGSNNPGFKRFVILHTKQLEAIGLDWESVYTQNLCQNYFMEETSKNKIWKEAAIKVWIPVLKAELDNLFDSSISVLLTSQLLLDVLLNEDLLERNKRPTKYDAANFYKRETEIPVPANQNKLERPLIPLYRGRNPKTGESYLLTNISNADYAKLVTQLL